MICDKDCFNCIHPDCIRDNMADKREYDQLRYEKEKDRRAEYNHRYYLEHKEQRKEYFKELNQKKKLQREKRRLYYKNNADAVKGYYEMRLKENPRYFADAMVRSREKKKMAVG